MVQANPNKSERIEKTIRRELAGIIKQELELEPDLLLTITRVEVSSDHRYAAVWVSFFPENDIEKNIKYLNQAASRLQWLLRKRIKLGFIPNLLFKYDKGILREARVNQILEKDRLESKRQEI